MQFGDVPENSFLQQRTEQSEPEFDRFQHLPSPFITINSRDMSTIFNLIVPKYYPTS